MRAHARDGVDTTTTMAAVVGGLVDAEAMTALRDLTHGLGCETLCTEEIFPMEGSGSVIY